MVHHRVPIHMYVSWSSLEQHVDSPRCSVTVIISEGLTMHNSKLVCMQVAAWQKRWLDLAWENPSKRQNSRWCMCRKRYISPTVSHTRNIYVKARRKGNVVVPDRAGTWCGYVWRHKKTIDIRCIAQLNTPNLKKKNVDKIPSPRIYLFVAKV